MDYWEEYEYDSDGNKIKYVKYKSSGNIDVWEEYTYEYDEDGNCAKMEVTDFSGNIKGVYEYEYSYDEEGNILTSREYFNGTLKKEIEYILMEIPVNK